MNWLNKLFSRFQLLLLSPNCKLPEWGSTDAKFSLPPELNEEKVRQKAGEVPSKIVVPLYKGGWIQVFVEQS